MSSVENTNIKGGEDDVFEAEIAHVDVCSNMVHTEMTTDEEKNTGKEDATTTEQMLNLETPEVQELMEAKECTSENRPAENTFESELVRKAEKVHLGDSGGGSSSAEEDTGSGCNSNNSTIGITCSKSRPVRRKKPPVPTRRPPPPKPGRRKHFTKTVEREISSSDTNATRYVQKAVKFQQVPVQYDSNETRDIRIESTPTPLATVSAASNRMNQSVSEKSKLLVGFKTPEIHMNTEPCAAPSANVDATINAGGFDSTMVMSPALRKSCMKAKKRSNRLFRGIFTKKVPAMKWSSCEVAAWLELLGLEDYAERFLANGVDGSTLLELDTRQFAQGLGVTNECHIVSLELGVMQLMLEKIDYDNWEWSAEKVRKWLTLRGFGCLRECFREAAIHGGVLFNVEFKYFMDAVGVKNINKSPIFAESLALSIERAKIVGNRIREMSHNESPADMDGPGVIVVSEKAAEYDHETVDVQDWGQTDVEQWLKQQHVGHLAKTFHQHGVNGTILLTLTRERMEKQMGLTEIQAIVLAKGLYRLKRMQRKGLGSFFRSKNTKKLTNSQSSDRRKLARAKSAIPVAQRIDFDVEMEVEMELAEMESHYSNNNSLTHKAKKFGDVLHKMRSVKSETNLDRMND